MSFQILKCQLTCGLFLHKSLYITKSKLCVSIDVQSIFVQVFVCQMSKTCKSFVKNTHCSPAKPSHAERTLCVDLPGDQFIHEFLQTVYKFGDNACTVHFTADPDRISPWWMDEFVDENMGHLSSISTAA